MITAYLAVVFLGFGAVCWLFFRELKKSQSHLPPQLKEQPKKEQPKDERNIPSLLARLGLDAKESTVEPINLTHLKTLEQVPLKSSTRLPKETQKTESPFNPSPTTSPLKESLDLETNTISNLELQEKIKKLESQLKERNEEIDKKDTALSHELKEKKEFNKAKDDLEKQIKDLKEALHKSNLEVGAAKLEGENYRKKIQILEEKLRLKEKEVLEKEKLISEKDQQISDKERQVADLTKRLEMAILTPKIDALPPQQPKPGTTETQAQRPQPVTNHAVVESTLRPSDPPVPESSPKEPMVKKPMAIEPSTSPEPPGLDAVPTVTPTPTDGSENIKPETKPESKIEETESNPEIKREVVPPQEPPPPEQPKP